MNSVLPPVKKAFSKAKGVLNLVPLPKIDEIYARLKGSKIYSTFDMRSGYYPYGFYLKNLDPNQHLFLYLVNGNLKDAHLD